MKVAVIIGTRPEAIRLYYTIKTIQPNFLYWTGQNFSKNLSDDILFDKRFGDTYKKIIRNNTDDVTRFDLQFSNLLKGCYDFIEKNKPEKVLILGDTNSCLAAAIASKKLNTTLYHMEAGNRCYNPKSPEETNRKIIDSISDVHLCYTEFAKKNLLAEGVSQNKIHVIGNPMAEFPEMHESSFEERHVLIDIHRAENEKYLTRIKEVIENLEEECKLIVHPRFFEKFQNLGLNPKPSVSFSQFVKLEKYSKLIITDSGTVCEEAAMLGKRCIVFRETMERPELLELGNTILCNPKNELYKTCIDFINDEVIKNIPKEYEEQKVSLKVKRIIQGSVNYI